MQIDDEVEKRDDDDNEGVYGKVEMGDEDEEDCRGEVSERRLVRALIPCELNLGFGIN